MENVKEKEAALKAAELKKVIDYAEMRYPGIEFVMQKDGNLFSMGVRTILGRALRQNGIVDHFCVLAPPPGIESDVTLPGFTDAPNPPIRKGNIPGDL